MNQSQLKYARSRAESIYAAKRSEIIKKHTTPAKRLSDNEKLEALQNGEFSVREYSHGWSQAWYNRISFLNEQEQKVDQESIDKESESLKVQYTTLLDQLILGDVQEALELLKAFEA